MSLIILTIFFNQYICKHCADLIRQRVQELRERLDDNYANRLALRLYPFREMHHRTLNHAKVVQTRI